jgi:hypothetical protein
LTGNFAEDCPADIFTKTQGLASAKRIGAEDDRVAWHAGGDQAPRHAAYFGFEGKKSLHRSFLGIQVFT